MENFACAFAFSDPLCFSFVTPVWPQFGAMIATRCVPMPVCNVDLELEILTLASAIRANFYVTNLLLPVDWKPEARVS